MGLIGKIEISELSEIGGKVNVRARRTVASGERASRSGAARGEVEERGGAGPAEQQRGTAE